MIRPACGERARRRPARSSVRRSVRGRRGRRERTDTPGSTTSGLGTRFRSRGISSPRAVSWAAAKSAALLAAVRRGLLKVEQSAAPSIAAATAPPTAMAMIAASESGLDAGGAGGARPQTPAGRGLGRVADGLMSVIRPAARSSRRR